MYQTGDSEAKQLASLELIIFDCDGALVDSEVLSIDALYRLILAEGGRLTKDEVIAQFQSRSMKSAKEELFASQGVALTQMALDAMNVELFASFYQALQPIRGVSDFIESLTLPFCIASSSYPERIDVSLDATASLFYWQSIFIDHGEKRQARP